MSVHIWTGDELAELERKTDEVVAILTKGGSPVDRKEVETSMRRRMADKYGWELDEAPATTAPVKKTTTRTRASKKLTTEAVSEAAAKEPYWYESERDRKFIRHFIALREAGVVGNLIIVGPSGAGKTKGVERLAQDLGKPFYKVDVGAITTEEKWVGHKEIDASGTRFVISDHLRWLEAKDCDPGIMLYDEINRAHPSKNNLLLPILDHSRRIHVPDLGRYIDVNEKTIIIATANIGSGFGGTYTMDRAFRERFNFTLERDFPPLEDEVRIMTTWTGADEALCRIACEIAKETRAKWQTGDLEQPVSTRTLVAVGYLLSSGMSVAEAFEYTVLPMYRNDGGASSERSLVKLILSGKSK